MHEIVAPDGRALAGLDRDFMLCGEGLLHDAIVEELATRATVSTGAALDLLEFSPDCSALVVASDGWDTTTYPQIREACGYRGLPWLPVRAELGRVVIGPLERVGVPGCVSCLELRRRRARLNPNDHAGVWRQHQPELARRASSWLTGLAGHTAASLVTEELTRLVLDADTMRINQAVLYLDLEQLSVTRHRILPDPLCPHCSELPEDAPDRARISLRSRPKPIPHTYRMRSVAQELDELVDTYVDDETGLVRTLRSGTDGGLIVAVASMRCGPHDALEPGFGRTRSYRTSELTALLEALERYGGGQPGGRRTTVRASYAEVANHALDPRTLGVHPPESYQRPGFPYRPFDDSQVSTWVWGYSFARNAPALVPEKYAYYRMHPSTLEERPFLYEISNGCALGSCLEEAILYGILEVAERDAFLMTWYGEMSVPRIDLSSARDRTVPMQAAAITAETGYRVETFNITVEHGLPCVWAMAVDPEGSDHRPKAVCAAGSHLDPEQATLNALSELGPILADLIRRYPAEAHRAHDMAANPSLVTTMGDHSLLYGAQEVFHRFDFLTQSTDHQELPDMLTRNDSELPHDDLRDDLLTVLGRFLRSGLDVMVVDQTSLEHRATGFTCVKVIIPGLIPMTFGYRNRRLDSLPRLYEVPHLLGRRSAPLRHSDLNAYPHPFP